jgi:hypothetical protein
MDTELHKQLKIIRAARIALQKQLSLLKQEEALLLQLLPSEFTLEPDLLGLLSNSSFEEHPFLLDIDL